MAVAAAAEASTNLARRLRQVAVLVAAAEVLVVDLLMAPVHRVEPIQGVWVEALEELAPILLDRAQEEAAVVEAAVWELLSL